MPQEAKAQTTQEAARARIDEEALEQSADVMNVVGNPSRLMLLYLLDNMNELRVPELADMLGVSVSAVSQHLSKLKAYGLVAPRREANTVYYGLSDHAFNIHLRETLFPRFQVGDEPLVTVADTFVHGFEDPKPTVSLVELHDPDTGRLDAARIANYLDVPLKKLCEALGKNYTTVHKTPSAPSLQPELRPIKRSIEILEEVFGERSSALAWWNNPLPDLGGRAPLEVLLEGHGDAVHDMLEAALVGTPS